MGRTRNSIRKKYGGHCIGKQWEPLGRATEQPCSEAQEQSIAEEKVNAAQKRELERAFTSSQRGALTVELRSMSFNPIGVKSNKM